MKQLISIIAIILMAITSAQAKGDIKTDTFSVDGNCDMCKKRIENAAYIIGVKRADWNKADHKIVVVYNSAKTNVEAIQQSIAKAGHNTPLYEAKEADYEKLPKCCHYKTEECHH